MFTVQAIDIAQCAFSVAYCMRCLGSLTGSVVLFPIAGLICEYGLDGKGFDGGWPSIFYIFGKLATYTIILSDLQRSVKLRGYPVLRRLFAPKAVASPHGGHVHPTFARVRS